MYTRCLDNNRKEIGDLIDFTLLMYIHFPGIGFIKILNETDKGTK